MRAHVCLYALIVLIAACAGSASMGTVSEANAEEGPPAGAKVVLPPDPKPGSWWILRGARGDRRVELVRLADGKFFAVTNGGPRVVYDHQWNFIEGPGPRSGAWTVYTPHIRRYAFPLWEGKKWSGWVSWSGGSYSGSFYGKGVAAGWEKVEVPAGTFEALRVEQYSNDQLWATCWYAAEVQYPAKCVFAQLTGQDHELVRYRLGE